MLTHLRSPSYHFFVDASHLIFGCGYLGRIVTRHWLDAGKHVAALSRSRSDSLIPTDVKPILGDVTDPATLHLPFADTILYAIGLDRSSGKSMREVYVNGLRNVLDVLPTPKRFIYVSSTSVYGQRDGGWVDESSPTEPAEENGRIVLECEQLLRERLPSAIILRFAGIYGPGRVLRRTTAIEKGEPIATDPDGWLNLIHVEDGAKAVLAAEVHGESGATYNVADGCPVLRKEFYGEIATILGEPAPRFSFQAQRTNRRISNRRMREELGVELQYPDFRTGLRQAIGAS
jgi:nucleoside-diphosphate-sugar epimerase